MPGIFGIFTNNSDYDFNSFQNQHYQSPYLENQRIKTSSIELGTIQIKEYSNQIFSNDDFIVIFNGYLKGINHKNISNFIYNRYLKNGELFVNELRGSFQILIFNVKEKELLLYVDHTSSRQLFYSFNNDDLIFSPEIFPIQKLINSKEINNPAIIHFMISGWFPLGNSFFSDIKMLKPGEYIKFTDSQLLVRKYFNYQIEPSPNISEQQFIELLDTKLEESIYGYWENAKNPAILLSGGYDSQFIFYSIANLVEDTSKLTTVTWGDDFSIVNSDVEAARIISKRFSTNHIEMNKTAQNFKSDLKEMFKAHAGMTDCTLDHASELQVCKKLRDKNIISLFRGDECFGFNDYAYSEQAAFSSIGKSYTKAIPGILNLLSNNHQNLLLNHDNNLKKSLKMYKYDSHNDLKDTLYFNERLVMFLQPINYFKLHYQEIFNPLIDIDVLKIAQQLPSKYRIDKALFKKLFNQKFGKYNPIISINHNMTDWQKEINENTELNDFLKDSIQNLPKLFNKNHLQSLLNSSSDKSTSNNLIKTIKKTIKKIPFMDTLFKMLNKKHSIPTSSLMLRIATLSEWFRHV